MKKIIFFAVLAVAFAGFGLQTGIVHAQTSNTATLQQQLDVAKATLVNLQMKAGEIPQGDDELPGGVTATAQPSATPSTGLSASEISYFNGVLTQLAGMLGQLNAAIAANPAMNQAQISSLAATLGTMKGTVAAIAGQIALDEQGGAPVAATSPSAASSATGQAAGTAGNGSNATSVAQTSPATSTAPATAATSTNVAPAATAQASSFWSFTKSNWPVLVIIVLVIAILAILFWPEKEAKAPTIKTSGPKPGSDQGSAPNGNASKTSQALPGDPGKKAA